MIDFIQGTLAGIMMLVLIAAIIKFQDHSCETIAGRMLMMGEYSIFTGCMIEYNNHRWVPLSSYRVEHPAL